MAPFNPKTKNQIVTSNFSRKWTCRDNTKIHVAFCAAHNGAKPCQHEKVIPLSLGFMSTIARYKLHYCSFMRSHADVHAHLATSNRMQI